MANPTTRNELKEYCLRKLGKPVIEINVDDTQAEDRIDDALKFYHDYHYDGAERTYIAHEVTQQNIDDKYVEVDDAILGVVRVFDPTDKRVANMFDVRYQLRLNDVYDFSSATFSHYYITMMNLAEADKLFVGEKPIRFNRHINRIYIDMDWVEDVDVGDYIILEVYRLIDPESFSDVYGDRWLRDYTTQLIKRQWGENLKKFEGIQLPGGLTMNGQRIYDEAQQEIEKMEQDIISGSSGVVLDMIG